MTAKNRNSEEAAHVRDLKASKRPRGKHSPEWSKLKKVRAENRASKDDGIYRRQITLGENPSGLNPSEIKQVAEMEEEIRCKCLPECYPYRSKEMGGPVHESACLCTLGEGHG